MRNDFSGLISRLTQRGEESLRLRYLNRNSKTEKQREQRLTKKKKKKSGTEQYLKNDKPYAKWEH